MAYEVFKRTTSRIDTPAVSIAPDGRIILNAAAVRIFSGIRAKTALLLWDNAASKIAIRAGFKDDSNSFAVSVHPRGHSASIRAKSFLAFIGWKGKQREMFTATWDAEKQMFEVTVPKVHRIIK